MLPTVKVKLDLFHAFKRIQCQLNLRNELHVKFNRQFQRAHYQYAPSVSPDIPHGKVLPGQKHIPDHVTLLARVKDVLRQSQFSAFVGVFDEVDGKEAAALSMPGTAQLSDLVKALNYHLDHITKNCLSDPDLPLSVNNGQNVARGSSANESWHRFCKSAHDKTSLIGTEYSAGIGRWLAFTWNNSQWMKNPCMDSDQARDDPTVHRSRWFAQASLPELFTARALFRKCAEASARDDAITSNPFDQFMLPHPTDSFRQNPDGTHDFTRYPPDFTPFQRYNPTQPDNPNSFLGTVAKGILASPGDADSPFIIKREDMNVRVQSELKKETHHADAAASPPRGWLKTLHEKKIRPVTIVTRNNRTLCNVTLLERIHAAICVHSATNVFSLSAAQVKRAILMHFELYGNQYSENFPTSVKRDLVEHLERTLKFTFDPQHPDTQPTLFIPVLRAVGALSFSGVILLQPNGDVEVVEPIVTGAAHFTMEKPLIFGALIRATSEQQEDAAWMPMTMSLDRTDVTLAPVKIDDDENNDNDNKDDVLLDSDSDSDTEDDDDDEIALEERRDAEEEIDILGAASNSAEVRAARIVVPVPPVATAAAPTGRQTDAAAAAAVGAATTPIGTKDEWNTPEKLLLLSVFEDAMAKIEAEKKKWLEDNPGKQPSKPLLKSWYFFLCSIKAKATPAQTAAADVGSIKVAFDAQPLMKKNTDGSEQAVIKPVLPNDRFYQRATSYLQAKKEYFADFDEAQRARLKTVADFWRDSKAAWSNADSKPKKESAKKESGVRRERKDNDDDDDDDDAPPGEVPAPAAAPATPPTQPQNTQEERKEEKKEEGEKKEKQKKKGETKGGKRK